MGLDPGLTLAKAEMQNEVRLMNHIQVPKNTFKCEYLSKIPAVLRQEFVSAPVFPQEFAWLHAPVPLANGQISFLENLVLLTALVALHLPSVNK